MRVVDGSRILALIFVTGPLLVSSGKGDSNGTRPTVLMRKGLRWPPYAEDFQKDAADVSRASNVEQPVHRRRHARNQQPIMQPVRAEASYHQEASAEYDYDAWLSGAQMSPDGEKDPVLPCQRGNPQVDAQDCDEPRPWLYQFPSGVLLIEAHANQTVRDSLSICSQVEQVEVDSSDDMETLLNSVVRHVQKYNEGPANSAVVMVNLENYKKWTKERIVDVLQTTMDVMRNFNDLVLYSKFHRDGSDSSDSIQMLLRYGVKSWLADMCAMRPVRCADVSAIVLGSVASFVTDIEDHLNPMFQKGIDQASVLTQKYCNQLGLGPGSRILDVRPIPGEYDEPSSTASEQTVTLSALLPHDPTTYDKNRPPKYHGRPTVVYYHITVLSIDTINEESMTYVVDIFLGQSWRDHRLRLPENMTTDYRILDVDWLHNIWRPDCFFKNAKKVTFHEMSVPNHYLWLYHDKTLLYMAKLTLVLSCAMKFETYPHDTQICSLMIESLSHTTHDLVFKWNLTDPLVVNPEIELPQLDIAKNMTEDCTLEYSTGNFTCLAVVFNLQRRLGYHLFHTYIPSALIVVMSWISFWIKPEAIPARVTLGVTSLLTLATQSTQSQRSLPPVSYVKGIDIWMSSCTVFVFMSLMEFAVVNHFMGPVATKLMKGYSDEDLSYQAVKGGISINGRGGSVRGRGRSGERPAPISPQYVTFCHGREVALFIDKWSRLFFPFSFMILNIVYWATFLPAQAEYS